MTPGSAWRDQLQEAAAFAQRGEFDQFVAGCKQLFGENPHDLEAALHIGATLAAFGFVSLARSCYTHARSLAPNDLRPLISLADLAQQAGAQQEASRLYQFLQERLPNHPVLRRNALTALEYDSDIPDAKRVEQAKVWGDWAVARAGRPLPRPVTGRHDGPLRVGYVSADLCQHTVGLFVKDVLAAHDKSRVTAFAYSAGRQQDWVTTAIQHATTFRDVSTLDDAALAAQIRADEINVLVDLSGHTGGSRLTAFALRPAPVQVSWLGYFATTGLPTIDAVLLDEWHAPPGTESQFVERIIRMPQGRLCYTPVPFAPDTVAPPPCLANGYITLGSFNNTAKYNEYVFDVWAQVLHAVPTSRLLLKWRTFHDEPLQAKVRAAFAERGIDPARIELRGASFHADVLKQYADIDIALDPFPFTGGLTSCEALWMGVPVVTWPQSRVVSRQTFAFLSQIGLAELAATDAEEYVRIAAGLAADIQRLAGLRAGMRDRMRSSPLCNVADFAKGLEDTYFALYNDFAAEQVSD
ncbi:methyltransferase type 11 [Oxalobacteraceae bacterium OM1]|nr:methyltransferase type 11 [Oxalobacteraceae bacterium OM1]